MNRFGKNENAVEAAYRQFVSEGIKKGRHPELVGGGLIRSLGGWFEVKALRNKGFRENADERILGSGEFVNHLLKEAEENVRLQFSGLEAKQQIEKVIVEICTEEDVSVLCFEPAAGCGMLPRPGRGTFGNWLKN